ncbi:MAG: DNA-processing protein DprA [Lachnospiraceae bacterium]|nr:DNA-processing protein DprA [Lachnospiraceae bacterium]
MKYRYWLTAARGGNAAKRKLLSVFGSARGVYEAKEEALRAANAVPDAWIDRLLEAKRSWDVQKEYDAFLQKQIGLVTLEEAAYPALLKEIYDAPYGLFYRGTLPEGCESCVAMVGARRPSGYGQHTAHAIAKLLAESGYSVVSGLALGIDGLSHQGALSGGGRTYAVLGCGADICYPKRHRDLYESIIANGAVLSEYLPGTPPVAEHFPARNRLISGLCKKTIVIEARAKSGSLITADFALEQGRDVYALPGRITDPLSEGTNRLIAQGAAMICSKEGLLSDFLELPEAAFCGDSTYNKKKMCLEKEELLVYSCFDFYAKSMDEVQRESGLELSALITAVSRLCRCGLIRETFKNHYARIT